MDFKFIKNLSSANREKNYYEFLFRSMFKKLLAGKRLRGEILKLEQGEKYEIELYQHVYLTLYKIRPKSQHTVTCTGGIYSKDKDIYYYFSLSETRDGKYKFTIEVPVHRYIKITEEVLYTDKNINNIYFLLEKEYLTWS